MSTPTLEEHPKPYTSAELRHVADNLATHRILRIRLLATADQLERAFAPIHADEMFDAFGDDWDSRILTGIRKFLERRRT
jgi:hypothetical protein